MTVPSDILSLNGRTCLTVLLSWNHEGSGLLKSLYIMWLLPFLAWLNQFISKRSDVLELVDSLQLNIKRNTSTPLTSRRIVFKGQVYYPDLLECLYIAKLEFCFLRIYILPTFFL